MLNYLKRIHWGLWMQKRVFLIIHLVPGICILFWTKVKRKCLILEVVMIQLFFFPTCATEGICLSLNSWNTIERWIKSISGHLWNFHFITHRNIQQCMLWIDHFVHSLGWEFKASPVQKKISSYGYSIPLWILVGCTNSTPIVIWRIMPTYSQVGIISYFSHEFNRKPTWGTEVAVNSRKFENSSITLAVPHVCDPCMQFFYIYTWNLSKLLVRVLKEMM